MRTTEVSPPSLTPKGTLGRLSPHLAMSEWGRLLSVYNTSCRLSGSSCMCRTVQLRSGGRREKWVLYVTAAIMQDAGAWWHIVSNKVVACGRRFGSRDLSQQPSLAGPLHDKQKTEGFGLGCPVFSAEIRDRFLFQILRSIYSCLPFCLFCPQECKAEVQMHDYEWSRQGSLSKRRQTNQQNGPVGADLTCPDVTVQQPCNAYSGTLWQTVIGRDATGCKTGPSLLPCSPHPGSPRRRNDHVQGWEQLSLASLLNSWSHPRPTPSSSLAPEGRSVCIDPSEVDCTELN